MNYLNINEASNLGGHPFSLNDLDSIQMGTIDLMNAVSAQHYDDFGVCLLSPPKVSISGGNYSNGIFYVILFGDGQVLRVASSSGVALSGAPGAKFYVRVSTAFLTGNPVTYESGASKNVHAESSAQLVHTASPGGNDYPFTHFNLCDWIDGSSAFSTAGLNTGVAGGYFSARYRLVSNNTMLLYFRMKGPVTGQVKLLLPFPYLSRNNYAQVIYGENLSDSETTMKLLAAQDSFEIIVDRIGGTDFTIGEEIEIIGATIFLEIKLTDTVF